MSKICVKPDCEAHKENIVWEDTIKVCPFCNGSEFKMTGTPNNVCPHCNGTGNVVPVYENLPIEAYRFLDEKTPIVKKVLPIKIKEPELIPASKIEALKMSLEQEPIQKSPVIPPIPATEISKPEVVNIIHPESPKTEIKVVVPPEVVKKKEFPRFVKNILQTVDKIDIKWLIIITLILIVILMNLLWVPDSGIFSFLKNNTSDVVVNITSTP